MTDPTENPEAAYRAGYTCSGCNRTIGTITTTAGGVLLLCSECLIESFEQATEDSFNESGPGSCKTNG